MTAVDSSASQMQTRYRRFNEIGFRLRSADTSALDWIEEFLSPAFPKSREQPEDRLFELRVDDREYDTHARRFSSSTETIDCFQMDGGFERLGIENLDEDIRLLSNPGQRVLYRIDDGLSRIECISPSSNPAKRKAFLRIVREFAMSRSWNRQRLIVHAAACSIGDRAILIAGAKQAGKTTLLLHCLRVPGIEILSGDRALLETRKTRGFEVRGIPTFASIRPDTLVLLPDLGGVLRERVYDSKLTLEEATFPRSTTFPSAANTYLTPAQFADAVERPLRESAELGAILFPRKADSNQIGLVPLQAGVAAKRLHESLFGGVSRGRTSVAIDPTARGASDASLFGLCEEIVSSTPAFECVVGNESFASASSAEDLIGELLG